MPRTEPDIRSEMSKLHSSSKETRLLEAAVDEGRLVGIRAGEGRAGLDQGDERE
jgi:hypothetical protein